VIVTLPELTEMLDTLNPRVITAVKDPVSDSAGEPLSVTRTVMMFVVPACAPVGVHVNAPVLLIAAPAGAPGSRE
jgi:hypothetical protein